MKRSAKGVGQQNPVVKNSNLNKTFHHSNTINKFNTPLKANNESNRRIIQKILNTDESKKYIKSKYININRKFQTEEKLDTNNTRNTHLSEKISDFNDSELNITKENNLSSKNEKSPNKFNIQKVNDGNQNLKNDKQTQPEDMNELFKTNFNYVSKFLDKNDILNLRLNKNWNRIILKSFISQKKDELILNERNLKDLREVILFL